MEQNVWLYLRRLRKKGSFTLLIKKNRGRMTVDRLSELIRGNATKVPSSTAPIPLARAKESTTATGRRARKEDASSRSDAHKQDAQLLFSSATHAAARWRQYDQENEEFQTALKLSASEAARVSTAAEQKGHVGARPPIAAAWATSAQSMSRKECDELEAALKLSMAEAGIAESKATPMPARSELAESKGATGTRLDLSSSKTSAPHATAKSGDSDGISQEDADAQLARALSGQVPAEADAAMAQPSGAPYSASLSLALASPPTHRLRGKQCIVCGAVAKSKCANCLQVWVCTGACSKTASEPLSAGTCQTPLDLHRALCAASTQRSVDAERARRDEHKAHATAAKCTDEGERARANYARLEAELLELGARTAKLERALNAAEQKNRKMLRAFHDAEARSARADAATQADGATSELRSWLNADEEGEVPPTPQEARLKARAVQTKVAASAMKELDERFKEQEAEARRDHGSDRWDPDRPMRRGLRLPAHSEVVEREYRLSSTGLSDAARIEFNEELRMEAERALYRSEAENRALRARNALLEARLLVSAALADGSPLTH